MASQQMQEHLDKEAQDNQVQELYNQMETVYKTVITEAIDELTEKKTLSVDTVASLESFSPGIFTNDVPLGGFTGLSGTQNYAVSMERLDVLKASGFAVVAAVIGVILKFLWDFFRGRGERNPKAMDKANRASKEADSKAQKQANNMHDNARLYGGYGDFITNHSGAENLFNRLRGTLRRLIPEVADDEWKGDLSKLTDMMDEVINAKKAGTLVIDANNSMTIFSDAITDKETNVRFFHQLDSMEPIVSILKSTSAMFYDIASAVNDLAMNRDIDESVITTMSDELLVEIQKIHRILYGKESEVTEPIKIMVGIEVDYAQMTKARQYAESNRLSVTDYNVLYTDTLDIKLMKAINDIGTISGMYNSEFKRVKRLCKLIDDATKSRGISEENMVKLKSMRHVANDALVLMRQILSWFALIVRVNSNISTQKAAIMISTKESIEIYSQLLEFAAKKDK